ncbi:MAG: hypothetical protein ENTB_03335 [Enterocloster aldenensis]
MKSIQTKFITLILGCVLLSSLVIGGAGIMNANQVVDKDSAYIMNLMCSEKANELNGLFSCIEQSVNTVAVYANRELRDVKRFKTDPGYVREYTGHIQDIAINAANNTQGALAVYVRYNPKFTSPTSGLFWSKTALDGQFQELPPTDFSRYSPDDVEHVGWYYLPVKSGQATWMAPYMNKNIQVEMISYVVPLYADNTTIGVVGMDIDFNLIKDSVDTIHVYDTGYAFLTDEQANIMYHREIPARTPMDSLESSLLPVADRLRSGGIGSQLFSYEWRGHRKQMALCSLKNGMRLAITVPSSEINAAKNTLILQSSIALIVISTLAVILTILMTRRLIKPLKELNEAARKIAEGDLSVSLSHQTKDEVGMLADSFQQTVSHLQKYINYINGLAYRDALTGVKNKTAYQETIANLEERTRTGRPEFAMIVFDINNLKIINDTLGHDFGDILIIDSCKLICKVFKRSPVYRIGGDEFVVILENDDFNKYEELLARFKTALDDYNRHAGPDSRISIARGIAIYEENVDLTVSDVFKRADDAMYQNKMQVKKQKETTDRNASGSKPCHKSDGCPNSCPDDSPDGNPDNSPDNSPNRDTGNRLKT